MVNQVDLLSKDNIRPLRFKALDGLRGFAILGVVLYHFGEPYNTYYPSDNLSLYEFPVGELGVQLFFMISGFVILMSAIKSGSARKFAISRFSRLYPTYWVSLLVSSALILLVGIEARNISLAQFVANLTMLQRFFFVENVDQVYWTLAVEMQFYLLIFAYLFLSNGRLQRRIIINFAILWSLVGFVLCLLNPGATDTGFMKILMWLGLAEHSALFCFGISMFFYSNDRKLHWTAILFASIATFNAAVRHGVMHGVIVLLLAVGFYWVVRREKVIWLDRGPLQFFGKISYPWYLCHTIMGFIIIHLLHKVVGVYPSIFIALGVTILWASLLHLLVEKNLSFSLRRLLTTLTNKKEQGKIENS